MSNKQPEPVDKYVGGRVRMRRMMLNLSQTDLGNALELTFQQVQKYEKGTNRISASKLQRISHLLQVPPAFFFEGAPNGKGHHVDKDASAASDFLTTRDGLSLARAFMSIKEAKVRRSIVNLVEMIAGG